MKLYTKRSCPFCHRVELAMAERNISQERISLEQIDFSKLSDSFLKINPFRKVPTLEFSDGNGFGESMIIVQYLDSLDSTGHKLFGDTPEDMSKMQFKIERLSLAVTDFLLKSTYTKGNRREEKKRALESAQAFKVFEDMLAESRGPFFGGACLNAMDIHVIPFVLRYAAMKLLHPDWIMPTGFARVNAYFQAAMSYPAVQMHLPPQQEILEIVTRHTILPQDVQNIKKAERVLVDDLQKAVMDINQQFKKSVWSHGKDHNGTFLSCRWSFENGFQANQALAILLDLEENSDHHTSFQLDDSAALCVQVCTHQPQWGVSKMDLAFAWSLTQRIEELLYGKA